MIKNKSMILKTTQFNTPLGEMVAVSDDKGLYILDFSDRKKLDHKIKKLCANIRASLTYGITDPISSIKSELEFYFNGTIKKFKTSFHLLGTTFQNHVWQELINIPYGKTRSYISQAQSINKPKAVRAVANANGANNLAILIPCHRIINSNGKLGGYGGGLTRKKWLIDHEQKFNYIS